MPCWRVYFNTGFHSIVCHPRESGTQGRFLDIGAAEEAMEGCRLLLVACSACFCYQCRSDTPQIGWDLSHQSMIKKMPCRLACDPVLWRHWPNSGSSLSDESSLCQGDLNLASASSCRHFLNNNSTCLESWHGAIIQHLLWFPFSVFRNFYLFLWCDIFLILNSEGELFWMEYSL